MHVRLGAINGSIGKALEYYERMHEELKLPYQELSQHGKAQAIRNAARQGANSALKEVELSFVIGPRPYIVHRTIKMSVYETLLYLDKNCCMLEPGKAQDLALAVLAQCTKCIPDVFYGTSAICADKVCCPRDISCGEIYKCSDIFGGCAPCPW